MGVIQRKAHGRAVDRRERLLEGGGDGAGEGRGHVTRLGGAGTAALAVLPTRGEVGVRVRIAAVVRASAG